MLQLLPARKNRLPLPEFTWPWAIVFIRSAINEGGMQSNEIDLRNSYTELSKSFKEATVSIQDMSDIFQEMKQCKIRYR